MKHLSCFAAIAVFSLVPPGACKDGVVAQHAKAVALPHSEEFRLGTQTHFGQNWPAQRLDLAKNLPTRDLRDGLSWAAAETERGKVSLPADRLAILRAACDAGIGMTMTAVPRNPLYEENNVVATPEGRAAFLAYLEFLLDALPGCIDALEIGNEINGAGGLPVAAGLDGPETYVALMKAVYGPLKRKAPGLVVLGGSTNAIGTGFLDHLFALGLLDHADGLAVHPYRDHGETIDWELHHLADVMARHGKLLPVWATEFSDNFDQAELAAPALIKMVTLLGAAGVERASWYALSDQQWFRHMGLFDSAGHQKPAARAFAFLQRELLPHGRPHRVSETRLLQLYAFGTDRWVAWGAPREAIPAEDGAAFNAAGDQIGGPVSIGTEPIIFTGARPSFGPTAILADSLLQFGAAPWSYHVRPPGGGEKELTPLDAQFATTLGDRYSRPLFATDLGGAVAGTRERPLALVLRLTAPEPQRTRAQACVFPNSSGEGLLVRLERNGSVLLDDETRGPVRLTSGVLDLAAGDRVDIILAPAGNSQKNNTFRYRIRLFEPGSAEPPCPANAGGWGNA